MSEYTYQQVMQAARKADAAGDFDAASRLIAKAKSMQEGIKPSQIDESVEPEIKQTTQQSLSKPVALGMEFIASVNRGAVNILDVAVSPLRALTISHPADPFSTESIEDYHKVLIS
jgi:hypothetical protein